MADLVKRLFAKHIKLLVHDLLFLGEDLVPFELNLLFVIGRQISLRFRFDQNGLRAILSLMF